MRISFLSALLALFHFSSLAQPSPNLVPNGSFEYYDICPVREASVSTFCKNWRTYTAGTSDYFHSCNGGTFVGVPNNFPGTQAAAHGTAYCGFITYHQFMSYREYLTAEISPMEPGKRYEVSFSISLAEYSTHATDGIGVFFYKNFQDTVGVLYPLASVIPAILPQLTFNSYGVDTNKTDWLRMTASYIPDSAYDHIVIGNFNANSGTTVVGVSGGTTSGIAYYYIDSITIKRDPYIRYTFNDTLLCAGDTINIPYTIAPANHFNIGNIFTLQLSNASGSFSSPTVLGTLTTPFSGTIRGIVPLSITPGTGYRIRIVGSSPAEVSLNNGYDIIVRSLPSVSGASNSPLCENSTLNLTASSVAGATYIWTGPNGFSNTSQAPSISPAQVLHTGRYLVRAIHSGCTSLPDTVDVVINKPSTIGAYVSPDDTICQGATAQFVAFPQNPGIIPAYQWYRNFVPVPGATSLIFSSSSLATGDKIHCQMVATGICATPVVVTTDTFEMVVLPIVTQPSVEITAKPGIHVRLQDTIRFTADVKNGGTTPKYQWYKNGVILPGARYATLELFGLSYMDMIHVDIISEDPCAQNKNASDTVWMQFPLGMTDMPLTDLRLYPNPNKGAFTITGVSDREVNVEVINALGQIVYTDSIVVSDNRINVQATLPPATYLLRLTSSEHQELLRFTVWD